MQAARRVIESIQAKGLFKSVRAKRLIIGLTAAGLLALGAVVLQGDPEQLPSRLATEGESVEPGSSGGPTDSPEASAGGQASTPRVSRGKGVFGGGTSGGVAGSRGVRVGPGVTDSTINIGVPYGTNGDQANEALGANVTRGDSYQFAKIMVKDINDRGGVAGRKLNAILYPIDQSSQQSSDEQMQAACVHFTQDNKVLAAFGGNGVDPYLQCLHDAGVFVIEEDATISSTSTFSRFPYYIEVGTLNLDRSAQALVEGLKAQGYLAKPATVGVATFDHPNYKSAVDKFLLPGLAAAGTPAKVVQRFQFPSNQSAGLAGYTAQVSAAVLQFNQEDVDRAILFDQGGGITLFFLNEAESQGYRPRYGITSQNAMQVLLDGGAVPASQMKGATGAGWWPNLDVSRSEANQLANSAAKRCLELMRANGQNFSDANAASGAILYCDRFWFFEQTMKQAGDLTADGFINVVNNKLGSSFVSGLTLQTWFDSTHHDGASAYRHNRFNDECGCFRYESQPIEIR